MDATIYYFSGTGNTYAVAKGIAEGLKGRLVPMAAAVEQDEINVETECVGIVFPIYYVDVPNIVRVLIPRLKGLSGKYVFAVCTYGGGRGRSIRTVRELLKANGGSLAAGYGIHMPQNAFLKPRENRDVLKVQAEAMVSLICRRTIGRKRGFRASEGIQDLALRPLVPIFKSVFHNYLKRTDPLAKDKTEMELIYQLDETFAPNEKCTGCGLCIRVCPVRNITMAEGRPVWNHRCENCLACYNLCPNKAIDSGLAHKDYYYLHPDYSAKTAEGQGK